MGNTKFGTVLREECLWGPTPRVCIWEDLLNMHLVLPYVRALVYEPCSVSMLWVYIWVWVSLIHRLVSSLSYILQSTTISKQCSSWLLIYLCEFDHCHCIACLNPLKSHMHIFFFSKSKNDYIAWNANEIIFVQILHDNRWYLCLHVKICKV